MATTFTKEQRMAIKLHGRNILVSAAAGSGKTAVLVERIVDLVCNEERPVDIDRLLVVTFTNAAAAEMRERIASGIAKRLSQKPESAHIQRQATLLHNAQITTIDSFCLFLLRNHFNEIGLDPAFRIADEGEVRLMQQEVMQELLEDAYASGSEDFRYCVEYFCHGGKESVLEQHILNLSRYGASFPWPARWLGERKGDYGVGTVRELEGSPCGLWLFGHLRRMAEGWAEKLRRVQGLCQEPDGPYMYGKTVDEELSRIEGIRACSTLEEYACRLPAMSFGRLPSKKDDSVSQIKRELAKGMREAVKDSVRELQERCFATPLKLAVEQGAACTGPVSALIDLALDFDRRMREKKQEKKVIDFSDMEHFALDILLDGEGEEARPSAVALEYRQHFVQILTDEYQDSNLVQEYLLRAVSGEEDGHFNRFMVGDVKQSIYKFRLARPELFLEKYNTYEGMPEDAWEASCADRAMGQGRYLRIDLARNFRSRPEVVDAVNDVFGRLMSETVGGIAYDERAALYAGASYPESAGCESELLLLEKPQKGDELGAKQAEALLVAQKIKALRESFLVTDRESGGLRPVRYSDMVILLRTNSGWDEEFKEMLEREGIPVYITSKTGYFSATEVQELLQLLRILDNPSQDIPLFGVMKSVFGGFTDQEVAQIRSLGKDCSLYQALKSFAQEYGQRKGTRQEGSRAEEGTRPTEDARDRRQMAEEYRNRARQAKEDREVRQAANSDLEELGQKAAGFLDMIAAYRQCTVYLPIRDLLTKLIGDFGYLDYVTALPAGGRRRANVEMLLTKASDFEKTSYFGLFHFIRYMEQLEKYDVDYGGAELLDENADVVRIMSIHKSKGLEFPVTFVSGLSKRFNMQDMNQSLILDMDLGLGTDYVDPLRRIRNRTLRRTALSRKLREESLSEELRLLYVAMTRAREKLILTGVLEDARATWERMQEAGHGRLSYLDFIEAGSYLDFLLPILPSACIRVTVIDRLQEETESLREQIGLSWKKEELGQAEAFADPEAQARLRARLNFVYPYAMLSGLYTKTTVSELKIAAMADRDEAAYHAFEEKEVQPYIPLFRRGEEKISGAIRGNAYHRVMELLDFQAVLGAAMEGAGLDAAKDYETYRRLLRKERLSAALRSFLEGETKSGRLSAEYLQAVRQSRIEKFLCSPLSWRMWRAQGQGCLYREQPFVLGIDARRLKGDFPDTETVLIQGIIDVFFEEEDGIVLLDYKTDAVPSMAELWNRYETQLDYYQEAVQKLLGRPVKERILYSFHLEEY